MELPIYNSEQPGCTYYFSLLSIYNLGMVNYAHEYEKGIVLEHVYAHIYHKGVGRKGSNNVVLLIIKTLGFFSRQGFFSQYNMIIVMIRGIV